MIDRTLDLVKTYVSTNPIQATELGNLIRTVYETLSTLSEPPILTPDISETVTDDYIVCLEDGRRLQILKRHLKQRYNMTPEEYRAKWKLPADYPMVAKNYGKRRSEIARAQGLGRPSTRP
jgi:predicted transcriptional regulator